MSDLREGGCQCGAVRYRVDGTPIAIGICHCSECQCQSGSAFGMSYIVRKERFQLLRGVLKTFTRTADSGRPVVGAFCPDCGTRIYNEPRYMGGVLTLKPGTLDDTSFLQPTVEVWAARKHPWVGLPAGLRSFERQPP
ncbi:MAG: GFA family protein [Candidatus Binatia bacterium]